MPGWQWKTTPKAEHSPTMMDLAWIAGLLEGEGSFMKATPICERVTCAQVDREPIDRLHALLGGRVRTVSNAKGFSAHKRGSVIHEWRVNGARARGVMLTLYPLLTTRRRAQIRKALSRQEN